MWERCWFVACRINKGYDIRYGDFLIPFSFGAKMKEIQFIVNICEEYGIPYMIIRKSCSLDYGLSPRWDGERLQLPNEHADFCWALTGLHEVAHWLMAEEEARVHSNFKMGEEDWEKENRVYEFEKTLRDKYKDQLKEMSNR